MIRLLIKRAVLVLLLITASLGSNMFAQTQAEIEANYNQGVRVGCNMARRLNENGCYRPSCASVVYLTFDRYIHTVYRDYAIGVLDGFNRCNTPPPPRTGRPNPGTSGGGGINDCHLVNGQIICN